MEKEIKFKSADECQAFMDKIEADEHDGRKNAFIDGLGPNGWNRPKQWDKAKQIKR